MAIEEILALPSIFTSADDGWIQAVFAAVESIAGIAPSTQTASYFTDGAVLREAYGGVPTVILGPGEAAMAHQTDESCSVSRVLESVAIYERLISDWIRAER